VVADPADLTQLHSLPAGYRAATVQPVDASAGRLVGTRTYVAGRATLLVRVGPRLDLPDPGAVESDVTIAGNFAEITSARDQRCASWTEISGRVREVCSVAARPLTAASLARVAASLR
jgi:hypothetical protein